MKTIDAEVRKWLAEEVAEKDVLVSQLRARIAELEKQKTRLIEDFCGRESVDCACSWDKDHDDVTGLCMAHEEFVAKRLAAAAADEKKGEG